MFQYKYESLHFSRRLNILFKIVYIYFKECAQHNKTCHLTKVPIDTILFVSFKTMLIVYLEMDKTVYICIYERIHKEVGFHYFQFFVTILFFFFRINIFTLCKIRKITKYIEIDIPRSTLLMKKSNVIYISKSFFAIQAIYNLYRIYFICVVWIRQNFGNI